MQPTSPLGHIEMKLVAQSYLIPLCHCQLSLRNPQVNTCEQPECNSICCLQSALQLISPLSHLMEYSCELLNTTGSLLHIHWIATKHPQEGCQLRKMPQCILPLLIRHTGQKVDVEQVAAEHRESVKAQNCFYASSKTHMAGA